MRAVASTAALWQLFEPKSCQGKEAAKAKWGCRGAVTLKLCGAPPHPPPPSSPPPPSLHLQPPFCTYPRSVACPPFPSPSGPEEKIESYPPPWVLLSTAIEASPRGAGRWRRWPREAQGGLGRPQGGPGRPRRPRGEQEAQEAQGGQRGPTSQEAQGAEREGGGGGGKSLDSLSPPLTLGLLSLLGHLAPPGPPGPLGPPGPSGSRPPWTCWAFWASWATSDHLPGTSWRDAFSRQWTGEPGEEGSSRSLSLSLVCKKARTKRSGELGPSRVFSAWDAHHHKISCIEAVTGASEEARANATSLMGWRTAPGSSK